MKLTILGSGTHIPVKNRSNPAYLLDIDGETILLDCGSGTLRQIAKAGRSEWEIDKIFLSHLHIDHTHDLIPLLFTFKYQRDYCGESKVLPIFAHAQFGEMLAGLEKIYGTWINGEKRRYKYRPVLPNKKISGKFTVDTFAANHAEHSIIFKFTDRNRKTLVYSGDTGPTEELIRAAYRADLLLIEGMNRDEFELEGHLAAKDIKQVIKFAQPNLTVITHLHPQNDNSVYRQHFKTEKVVIAEDLQVIDLEP